MYMLSISVIIVCGTAPLFIRALETVMGAVGGLVIECVWVRDKAPSSADRPLSCTEGCVAAPLLTFPFILVTPGSLETARGVQGEQGREPLLRLVYGSEQKFEVCLCVLLSLGVSVTDRCWNELGAAFCDTYWKDKYTNALVCSVRGDKGA